MKVAKSPGAVAALGASEDDQLRGTVDPEDSLRGFTAQPLRLRAGIPKTISALPKNHADTIAAVFARVFVGGHSNQETPS